MCVWGGAEHDKVTVTVSKKKKKKKRHYHNTHDAKGAEGGATLAVPRATGCFGEKSPSQPSYKLLSASEKKPATTAELEDITPLQDALHQLA